MTGTTQAGHGPTVPDPRSAVGIARIDHGDGVVVVACSGEVDLASAPGMREELAAACVEPIAHLILDASRVAFFGAAGMDAIDELTALAAGLGAQVDIVGAPRCMARVLEITGRGSLLSQHALDDVLADPVKSS